MGYTVAEVIYKPKPAERIEILRNKIIDLYHYKDEAVKNAKMGNKEHWERECEYFIERIKNVQEQLKNELSATN